MTTPTNDRQPVDSPDDLPPLSPDATPWKSALYRDENARLLVGAMYRQREALSQLYPDVPVQGYDIVPPTNGPDGALTCGVLLTLWQHSDLCRGECPHCDGTALAMSVGGTQEDWVVVGICQKCASHTYRQLERTELLRSLAQSLEGTGYSLPTESQLLFSNAHQHLALVGALRALGEKLLPPDHYGLAVAMPEVMRLWASATAERVNIWAQRGGVTHLASDAGVEKNLTLAAAMTEFVHEYLVRTGTLPELHHDAPDGLRYHFPMSSQEPVSFRVEFGPTEETWWDEDEEQSEWDDDDKAAIAFQSDIDTLVARVEAGGDTSELLRRIQETLEADPDWTARDAMGVFLSPTHIQDAYEAIDVDEVREALELRQSQRVTPARRIQFLEQYRLPALCEDADVTHMFVPVTLISSDGDELTLMASVQGYSFTMIRTEWWGLVESDQAFRDSLLGRGWIDGVKGFQKLPSKRKLAIVNREVRHQAVPNDRPYA